MTWLLEGSPYWICNSCGLAPAYKPQNCQEARHEMYYAKRVKRQRNTYHKRLIKHNVGVRMKHDAEGGRS